MMMFSRKMPKKLWVYLLAGWMLALFASPACADSGVPMIFVTLPGMVIAIIPVIILETIVNRRIMKLSIGRTIGVTVVANLVSTFVGIPLTWLALAVLQIFSGGGRAYGLKTLSQKFLAVTWQAPWLIPYGDDLRWMVPAAMLALLIPFFLVSYFVEYYVIRRLLRQWDHLLVGEAVWNANLLSYGLLALVVLGFLLMAWFR